MRLVNAATSKRTPSTRCIASPWLDTSITRCVAPVSRAPAREAHQVVGLGVVCVASRTPPGPRTLDRAEHRRPRVAPHAASASTRYAVVVLPLVPVMPTTSSRRVGSPYRTRAIDDSATSTSSHQQQSARSRQAGCSASTATAPRAIASAARIASRRRAHRRARRTDRPARRAASRDGRRARAPPRRPARCERGLVRPARAERQLSHRAPRCSGAHRELGLAGRYGQRGPLGFVGGAVAGGRDARRGEPRAFCAGGANVTAITAPARTISPEPALAPSPNRCRQA